MLILCNLQNNYVSSLSSNRIFTLINDQQHSNNLHAIEFVAKYAVFYANQNEQFNSIVFFVQLKVDCSSEIPIFFEIHKISFRYITFTIYLNENV